MVYPLTKLWHSHSDNTIILISFSFLLFELKAKNIPSHISKSIGKKEILGLNAFFKDL